MTEYVVRAVNDRLCELRGQVQMLEMLEKGGT